MTEGPEGDQPVGVWLRLRREAAGVTQEELAHRSGVSTRAISDLERGRTRKPHPQSVRLVAGALGVDQAACDELVARCRAARRTGRQGGPTPPDPESPPTSGVHDGSNAPAPGSGTPQPVPRELPASAAHFAGRAKELETLDGWLAQASGNGSARAVVICVIGGMAGVGKTTLALQWAHRVAGRFPDGQLYVNLRGYDVSGRPMDTGAVIRKFLDALGAEPRRIPGDLDSQLGLYRSLMAGRRMLIVADNASDAAQVRALLPGAPGSLVLVTGRSQLAGLAAADGASLLNLDPLGADEASEVLAARLGAGRVGAEPQAAAELIELCAGLPLALSIVAARAAATGWPLAAVAAELSDGQGRLDVLDAGDAMTNVRTVFSWSFRQLSPGAAGMFRLLGLHPGPDISARAAASLAGLPLSAAREALYELAGVSLISERTPGRYLMHDLLRIYAAERAEADGTARERRAGVSRLLDHYLHSAAAAARVLNPCQHAPPLSARADGVTPEKAESRKQALAWFNAEHKVLLGLVTLAAEEGFDAKVEELARTLTAFFHNSGRWPDVVAFQRVALESSGRLGDQTGQARAHCAIGRAYIRLGDTDLARTHLTQALELARCAGARDEEANIELALSVLFEIQGDYRESLSCSLRALRLAEAARHPLLVAAASNNCGYDHAMLGDFGEGLRYCQQALELYGKADSPPLAANTWDSLGYIYRHLGDFPRAIDSHLRAIGLFDELGDRWRKAQALRSLGDTYQAAGDTEAAWAARQDTLAILGTLDPMASRP